MMLGVVAAKHAGATTAAMALAAAAVDGAPPLLVEADPAGGDLAATTGASLDPGLLTLAAAGRRGLTEDAVLAHTQHLDSRVAVLFAPVSPVQAAGALAEIGSHLGPVLAGVDRLVVIDAGRRSRSPAQGALLSCADVTLVVVRPTVAGVEHLRVRLAELASVTRRVTVVTIGERPYHVEEIAEAVDVEVLGALAWDPRGAHTLLTGTASRALRRTPLVRSARSVLDRVMAPPALVEAER